MKPIHARKTWKPPTWFKHDEANGDAKQKHNDGYNSGEKLASASAEPV